MWESLRSLTLPTMRQNCSSYFQSFHSCFPILDKVEIARRFSTGMLSLSLLQATLFIEEIYCDEIAIHRPSFQDRHDANLYNRVQTLFEEDWETEKEITLQTVVLLNFCRARLSDTKDVRYR
jgi:hypothetical protein